MKAPRLVLSALLASTLGFALAGCVSGPDPYAQVRATRTFAIVAADDQGVLAPEELANIRIGIVQYLSSQGYLQSDQVYTDDLVHADLVFRVKIAWLNEGAGYAVTEVVPSYGGTTATEYPEEPAQAYAPVPYEPWDYDDDEYGYYGYDSGPYAPWLLAPFLPIFGGDHHHRPSPSIVHRPPAPNHPGEPHRPWWLGSGHHLPSRFGGDNPPSIFLPRRPLPTGPGDHPTPPPLRWRSPATDADHRPATNPSGDRPRNPPSDRRPVSNPSSNRPRPSTSPSGTPPSDNPPNWNPRDHRSNDRTPPAPDNRPVGRPASTPPSGNHDSANHPSDHAPAPGPRNPGSADHPSSPPPTRNSSPAPRNNDSTNHPSPHSPPPAPRNPGPMDHPPSPPPARNYSPPPRAPSPPPSPPPARSYSPAPAPSSSSSSSSSSSPPSSSRSSGGDRDSGRRTPAEP